MTQSRLHGGLTTGHLLLVLAILGLFGTTPAAWGQEGSGDLRELVQGLLDSDQEVRRQAAERVGSMRFPRSGFDEAVVERLAIALGSEDNQVRIAAACAFSHLTMLPPWPMTPNAVDALGSALKDSESSVVKCAAHALGHVNDPRALLPLIRAMRTDKADIVNVTSAALGHLISKRLLTDEAIQALIESLGFERAARAVVHHLSTVRNRVPLSPLMERLADKDVRVRKGAAMALAALRITEATPALVAALQDDDQEVRRQTAIALAGIGGPAVVLHLAKAAEDPEEAVRLAAVGSLWRGGKEALEPLLQRLAKDESPKVRREAAIRLRMLGDPRAARPLLDALRTEDNDDTWMEIASGALGHWNDNREVAREIVRSMTAAERKERGGAAIALQVDAYKVLLLSEEEAVPLDEALTDPDVGVRQAAAGAFRLLAENNLRLEWARTHLQAAAKDQDAEVRRLAQKALAVLGPPPPAQVPSAVGQATKP